MADFDLSKITGREPPVETDEDMMNALADALGDADALRTERDAMRARVAEADRLLREWHHYYHNPASTDAEGTDDDTSTWLAGLSGNKSPQ